MTGGVAPRNPARSWRSDGEVWRCAEPTCRRIIGFVAPGGRVMIMHMKRVIEITGGTVTQICDDCGTTSRAPEL